MSSRHEPKVWEYKTSSGWKPYDDQQSIAIMRIPVGETAVITIGGSDFEITKKGRSRAVQTSKQSGRKRDVRCSERRIRSSREREDRHDRPRSPKATDSPSHLTSEWQWQDSDASWYSCGPEMSADIDKLSPGSDMQVILGDVRYSITRRGLDSGIQTDVETREVFILRKVTENHRESPRRRRSRSPQRDEAHETPTWEFELHRHDWRRCSSEISSCLATTSNGRSFQAQIRGQSYTITKIDDTSATQRNDDTGRERRLRQRRPRHRRRRDSGDEELIDEESRARSRSPRHHRSDSEFLRWEVEGDSSNWYPYPPDVCAKISALPIHGSIRHYKGSTPYIIIRTGATTAQQTNPKTNRERVVRVSSHTPTWQINLSKSKESQEWHDLDPDLCERIERLPLHASIPYQRRGTTYRITRLSANRAEQLNPETDVKRWIRREEDLPRGYFDDQGGRGRRRLRRTDKNDVQAAFYKDMPNSAWEIVKIEPARIEGFSAYCDILAGVQRKLKRKDVERKLWHGTSAAIIQTILIQGFLRDFNSTHAYGKGVYFGGTSQVSHGYTQLENGTRQMFYARVIVGDMVQGTSSLVRPPTKADGVTEYDCMVNNVANPSIFVIGKDYHAVPEYVITYKQKGT